MEKLIVNESVDIKTVGDLKKILSKYNDDLEIQISNQENIKTIFNVGCNNETLFIELKDNKYINLEDYLVAGTILSVLSFFISSIKDDYLFMETSNEIYDEMIDGISNFAEDNYCNKESLNECYDNVIPLYPYLEDKMDEEDLSSDIMTGISLFKNLLSGIDIKSEE